MSDIDTAAADSLKVLDPKRPIREADINQPTSPELVETTTLTGTCDLRLGATISCRVWYTSCCAGPERIAQNP